MRIEKLTTRELRLSLHTPHLETKNQEKHTCSEAPKRLQLATYKWRQLKEFQCTAGEHFALHNNDSQHVQEDIK